MKRNSSLQLNLCWHSTYEELLKIGVISWLFFVTWTGDAHVADVFRMPKSTRCVRYRTYCIFLVRITNQSCSVSPAADWIARMSNSGLSVDLTIAWAYSRTRDSSPARQMITNGRLGLACFASLAS